jgi:ribosomal-protein-alanine acetyltransferase
MRVRSATSADLPRLIELMRGAATAAQWSEKQFAEMFGRSAGRIVLVLETGGESERGDATREKQVLFEKLRAGSRYAQDDQLTGEEAGLTVEGFAVAHMIASGNDISVEAQTLASECEIENIVVDAKWQRRAFGRKLLDELLNRIQQAGCGDVFLEVRESNMAARRLYERGGFLEVGRRAKYYSQPQEDAVTYRFRPDESATGTVQI